MKKQLIIAMIIMAGSMGAKAEMALSFANASADGNTSGLTVPSEEEGLYTASVQFHLFKTVPCNRALRRLKRERVALVPN